ncbi:hypothetical protein CALCODRAFT_501991 [Calocera cornea HHB12733]|uniref:Small ribosomal subunit protein mS35 mitochondrial conserved domain-containing protein n=1 Tax=Calocera cornea HHB12733 TaxID=1353952 RepID=A0A165DER6_9BASI|nr:hypothetical protein CALCODRAFT_501991 [Calocera cornea HHB12733]
MDEEQATDEEHVRDEEQVRIEEDELELDVREDKLATSRDIADDPGWYEIPEFRGDDIPSHGHDIIADERQYIEYMRYIEIDGPELEKLREPFKPLSHLPIRLRSIGYGGQIHPAQRKVALTCPVSSLPLTPAARHKFKLVAGARWSPYPPTDAGITESEHATEGKEGWFKISCEQFPHQAQNAKWCSDKLDELVVESNNQPDYYADVPVDMRHIHVQEKKHPRHTHVRGNDFPLDWIPETLREEAKKNGDAKEQGGRLPPR